MTEDQLKAVEKDFGVAVTTELKKLDDSVKDTHAKLKETVDQQREEIKSQGVTASETKSELDKLAARYEQEVAELKGFNETHEAKIEELQSNLVDFEAKQAEFAKFRESKGGCESLKDFLDNHSELKSWRQEAGAALEIPVGRFDKYSLSERKNITGGASLDAVLGVTNWATIYGEPVHEWQHMRQYMNVQTATGHSVAYVRRTAFDNQAAFQVAGDLKADSAHTFEDFSAEACVLAHTADITKQQARSTPSIVDYIRNDLVRGLYDKESVYILYADGTAGSFKGITNTTGVQTYVRGKAGDTMIDALKRSETQLRDVNKRGTLYVVHHYDWEDIMLAKDSEKRYLWTDVQTGGTERMWQKPVFVTPAQREGTFINGDFQTSAKLLDFEKANAQIFPQHSDFAKRNMALLLAEETISLAVTVPAGFVVGSYTSIGSGS